MYISPRAALVRNISIAVLNGTITLIILLIAPLGLAGVIINTLLVTTASFVNATFGDRVIQFLQASSPKFQQMFVESPTSKSSIYRSQNSRDRDGQNHQ